jgi:cell division control protein 7
MDDIEELYGLFPEIKQNVFIEKKVGQGTFSYVYQGYFYRKPAEKLALKYIIPTSSPARTKQEIECLLNIG